MARKVTLQSQKDGERGERGATFASRCPNSYLVLVDGHPCGAAWKGWGADKRWNAYITDSAISVRCDYLREIPAALEASLATL